MKTKPYNRHETFLAALSDSSITVPDPLSREELYLAKIAGESVTIPDAPYNRYETYLAKLAGEDVTAPAPASRLEYYLYKACGYACDVPVPANREEVFWKRYVGEEVTGRSISIDDALPGSVRAISVQIQGEQTGSGTPSIDNPRPITAYSSAVITIADGNGDTQYTHTIPMPTDYDVYSGELNIKTGALTVNAGCKEFHGTETWINPQAGTNKFMFRYMYTGFTVDTTPRACSHYPNANLTTSNTTPGYYAYTSSNGVYIQFRPNNLPNTTTSSEWNSYLADLYSSGKPLQAMFTIRGEIASEVEPVDVQLLEGTNVITANCGTITLKYTPDL